ncbi:hypothetical protein L3Q82_001627 [Scortum barcoo]|uniref:Uncharacterized protein n=1 Tax=Scortum barcoo TaxID=214431 RepID=A0ACB8W493_9TELE|nr:hypothetical protein L3Q82_001627 [Scortum barcoo]
MGSERDFAKGCSGLCTTRAGAWFTLPVKQISLGVGEPQDFISAFCDDDVVLMASSGQDLQHVLERFAAECEVAGMRISTSKSEAMVLDRKRVACPLRVGGERPASSGGVQVSQGLVHE